MSDRKALIRLAATLPKGSEERKAILTGLKTAASPDVVVLPSRDGSQYDLYFKSKGGSLGALKKVYKEWDGGRGAPAGEDTAEDLKERLQEVGGVAAEVLVERGSWD